MNNSFTFIAWNEANFDLVKKYCVKYELPSLSKIASSLQGFVFLKPSLDFVYKYYSKLIPTIGKFVVGEKKPYEYLIKSIKEFINQEELITLMKKNNFQKCTFRNFSGGIVSVHSGWKF